MAESNAMTPGDSPQSTNTGNRPHLHRTPGEKPLPPTTIDHPPCQNAEPVARTPSDDNRQNADDCATTADIPVDREQISRLIQQHHGELYGYAYRLSGSAADAEDLTQQVFLTACRKLHQVRDTDAVRGWLFQVLRSCFNRTQRRKRPTAAVNVELDVECVAMEQSEEADVDKEALQIALNTLSEEQRQVVTMFYFEELSYLEIADTLKIAAGTVMSRLSRAKAKLRQQLAGAAVTKTNPSEAKLPLDPSSVTGGC